MLVDPRAHEISRANLSCAADLFFGAGLVLSTEGCGGVAATVRKFPDDFVVEESPLYEPVGCGEHLYVRIEKRGLSTWAALSKLARFVGCAPRDVGYAGLKDAHAVTVQTLSFSGCEESVFTTFQDERVRILDVGRHTNKLRRGHLRGNRFRLRLRDVPEADDVAFAAIFDKLVDQGMPNYFGYQRFGGPAGNNHLLGLALLRGQAQVFVDILLEPREVVDRGPVREAKALWQRGEVAAAASTMPHYMGAESQVLRALARGRSVTAAVRSLPKQAQQLLVSAAQSLAFNALLARRVAAGTYGQVEAGDVAMLHDRGACFVVEDVVAEQARASRFEISPAGPLFGSKLLRSAEPVAAVEQEVFGRLGVAEQAQTDLCRQPPGARRAFRVPLAEASWSRSGTDVDLCFTLPPGSYATVVLEELLKRPVA